MPLTVKGDGGGAPAVTHADEFGPSEIRPTPEPVNVIAAPAVALAQTEPATTNTPAIRALAQRSQHDDFPHRVNPAHFAGFPVLRKARLESDKLDTTQPGVSLPT